MERIYRYRMTTTSGGNLSIREAERRRLDHARARRQGRRCGARTSCCVRADGAVEGDRTPSSELPHPPGDLRGRGPTCAGIVHAHPVALVAFSLVHQVPEHAPVPPGVARLRRGRDSPPYELPGSEALGQRVADTFAQGFDCVILENHGVVTGGRGPAGGLPPLRDAGVHRQDPDQGAPARRRGPLPERRTDSRLAATAHRELPGVLPPRSPSAREKELRAAALRIRPPRLPAAAVHQHAGQLLGPRG